MAMGYNTKSMAMAPAAHKASHVRKKLWAKEAIFMERLAKLEEVRKVCVWVT